MDLRQIRQFLALSETGNFYKAADRLGLTQSALTQGISKLERETGIQLFVRSKTGTILTDDGRRLLDHAKIIMAQIEAAEGELKSVARGKREVVKVGLVESISDELIIRVLTEFYDRYDHCNIKVTKDWSAGLLPKLTGGELDFAILSDHFLSREVPEIERELLFKDQVRIVVSAKHDLYRRDTVSLSDLSEYRWVGVDLSEDWASNLARAFLASDIQPPLQVVQTNSFTFATLMILEGKAVGLVSPKLFSETAKGCERVKFFDVPELGQDRRFSICYRTRTVFRNHHKFLIDRFALAIREHIPGK